MKPDTAAFESFRTDHGNVLARIGALDRLFLARMGTAPPTPLDEVPIRELVGLLETQFATHMRDEEELLFPALAESLPETATSLGLLRGEHEELRQMLAAIASQLDRSSSPARDEQVVVQFRDFVDLLRLHIHKEEATVFNIAARALAPLEITALSRRIAARHAQRGDSPRRKT
jgi:hemerythrin-like domain-containing protein